MAEFEETPARELGRQISFDDLEQPQSVDATPTSFTSPEKDLPNTKPDLILTHPTPDPEIKGQHTLPPTIATVLQDLVERKMWEEKTPKGNILYVDMNNPHLGTLIDNHTLKKTGELDPLEGIHKQLAASIITTASLAPETSGDLKEMLEKVFKKANIQKGQKNKGVKTGYISEFVDVPSHAGIIIVVEKRGEDIDPEWRKNLMAEVGLKRVNVISGRPNHPIIWEAGRKRESVRQEIDATETRAGNVIESSTQSNLQDFHSQGVEVNNKQLRDDQKASRMIPGTIERSKDFQGVTLQDKTTGDIVKRNLRGYEFRSNIASEEDREIAKQTVLAEREKNKPPKLHKPGDKVESETTCWDCGQHMQDQYFALPGKKRMLLFKKTICTGPHPDGYPIQFGDKEYVRPLNLLAQNQQKARR